MVGSYVGRNSYPVFKVFIKLCSEVLLHETSSVESSYLFVNCSKHPYSMLNLPGDLVRRAAANVSSTVNSTVNTVSSTVSSVASVASGKRRASEYENNFEDQVLANAKEKYNFTVKVS